LYSGLTARIRFACQLMGQPAEPVGPIWSSSSNLAHQLYRTGGSPIFS